MRIKTIISGAMALVLTIYALIVWNMTHGLNVYMLSYDTGKWLIWVHIPIAIIAAVGWVLFLFWIPRDAVAVKDIVKKKLDEAKARSEELRMQQVQQQWQTYYAQQEVQSPAETDTNATANQDSSSQQQTPAVGAANFCVVCGAPVKPGQKFCTSCGTPLNQ